MFLTNHKLRMKLRLALKSRFSCPLLPSASIKGVCYHIWSVCDQERKVEIVAKGTHIPSCSGATIWELD